MHAGGQEDVPLVSDREIPRLIGLPLLLVRALRAHGIYETKPRFDRFFNWHLDEVEAFQAMMAARRASLRPVRRTKTMPHCKRRNA